jgi:hypothetical protein
MLAHFFSATFDPINALQELVGHVCKYMKPSAALLMDV